MRPIWEAWEIVSTYRAQLDAMVEALMRRTIEQCSVKELWPSVPASFPQERFPRRRRTKGLRRFKDPEDGPEAGGGSGAPEAAPIGSGHGAGARLADRPDKPGIITAMNWKYRDLLLPVRGWNPRDGRSQRDA